MSHSMRAAMLGTSAIFAYSAAGAAQDAPAPNAADLPPVVVMSPGAKPKAAAVKPKPNSQAAESYQPAAPSKPVQTADPSATVEAFEGGAASTAGGGAGGPVAPGTRSGSMTAPTTAEAKADIETTPGGVDLVSDKEYKLNTPSVTLKDALDYVPGVFVQPKWGEDSRLSIRGSGLSRNFHGRGVTLLMDGVIPITTSDGDSDFQEIDPTAYRYIEVYKGANALRFGANSLGGAINFVMPTGYDSDAFGARVDVGSFGFHKFSVSSGGVSGAADYFITGTIQEQDGFREHSDSESQRGAMNVGYRLSEDVETRFYLNANRVRQRIPGAVTKFEALTNPQGAFVRLDIFPVLPFFPFSEGNDNVDRNYQRNIDSIRVANKTTIRMAPGTTVEFGGFYFDKHLDHPILFVLDNKTDNYGGFARIVEERDIAGFKNRFIAGININNGETRSRFFQSVNAGQKGFPLFDADQTSDNTIVYAENSFFVSPTVAIVTGAQYAYALRKQDDRLNPAASGEADFDFFSPKVGVIWNVTPSAQIFANVSESGEAPTFGEVSINGPLTTSLDPQEARTYEIGTRGGGNNFLWDVSFYRANIDNEFQCLNTLFDTCAVVNADKTIHQGVEIGLSAVLFDRIFETGDASDKLWLNTAYTFSDFRFDNDATFGDNELPGAPRHFLRAELLYKHPSGVYFGPNVEWVPEAYFVDNANTLETKRYALLGAKVGYDSGDAWTAYIEARNIADKAYISSSEIGGDFAGVDTALFEPGNGRAVYGGVQVKW